MPGLVKFLEVLSDECELVSVWHECGDICLTSAPMEQISGIA